MNNSNYYTQARVSQHSLVMTFAWMTLGLLVTGITSTFFLASGLFIWMIINAPFMIIGLLVGQIALTIAFTFAMRKATATLMKVLFLIYAVTFGVSITSVAYAYGIGVVSLAFFVAAIFFICLAIIGVTSKRDFTGIGMFALSALIALIITQVILMIFRIPLSTRFICLAGLLIFAGITIFDVQRASRLLTFDNGDVVTSEKISIYLALQLYLDFINIFLYIVRLLGSKKR